VLGHWRISSARTRTEALRCADQRSAQLLEQRFRLRQVSGVEALGEPPVDGRQEVCGRSPLAPALLETRQTGCGPKLERPGRLSAGDEVRLGRTLRGISPRASHVLLLMIQY
jgi:hypothetical protein